jgi:hypothetical protein
LLQFAYLSANVYAIFVLASELHQSRVASPSAVLVFFTEVTTRLITMQCILANNSIQEISITGAVLLIGLDGTFASCWRFCAWMIA